MAQAPPQAWFEMQEVRRRRLANAVWVPLRQSETLQQQGENGRPGSQEEVGCVGSVAIYVQNRDIGERLGWSDIGLIHDARPYAFRDGRYKPADVYLHNDREAIGVELILAHFLNSHHEREWRVNQDLVLALGLLREGDTWRRADEGYIEVIRQRRDSKGRVVAIEIRAEFLRDYLCARGFALRIAQYRQRMAILTDALYLTWSKQGQEIESEHERFSAHVFEVDPDGGPFGGRVAVMKVWRTDVDNDEDVPVFGHETDENTAYKSYSFERTGDKAYRAESELWREEWIEPAERSERVRGDQPAEDFFFIVGAAGERMAASELNDEDVGRWLWFRAEVINTLLHFRGSGLRWYTRDTGAVKCSPDHDTHFGVNLAGRINVYAYDVAKLPQWQQRVWLGFNIAPDGPVSSELLDSQMRAESADTAAPEMSFSGALAAADAAFIERYGRPLFREHDNTHEVLARVHRFRALEPAGLLALAKDVARLTADAIDVTLLQSIVTVPEGARWRSLRLLQHALAQSSDNDAARDVLGALVGIYELRLGDAHMPSSDIEDAYRLARVDPTTAPLNQATALLDAAVTSLQSIAAIVRPQRSGTA